MTFFLVSIKFEFLENKVFRFLNNFQRFTGPFQNLALSDLLRVQWVTYLVLNSLMHWPPALVEMLFLHDDPPSGGARNVAFSTQFFLPSWVAPSLMMGMGPKILGFEKSWRNGFYSAKLFWISFAPIFEEVKFAYLFCKD